MWTASLRDGRNDVARIGMNDGQVVFGYHCAEVTDTLQYWHSASLVTTTRSTSGPLKPRNNVSLNLARKDERVRSTMIYVDPPPNQLSVTTDGARAGQHVNNGLHVISARPRAVAGVEPMAQLANRVLEPLVSEEPPWKRQA